MAVDVSTWNNGRLPYYTDIMSLIGADLQSLSGLTAFVRAAEAGGFAAAGRRLGVSASAVGKSVARLEAELGVRLFHRTTRSITLTDEGEILLERGQRILSDLANAEAELASMRETPRGRLRVSLPAAFGQFCVVPQLPSFLKKFPDLEIEADLDDRQVNLIEEGYDLAVRIAPDFPDSDLVVRKLGDQRFVVCAAPEYLARRGVPETVEDISKHDCIGFNLTGTGRQAPWRFTVDGRPREVTPATKLAFNNNAAMLTAALAGQGLAHLPNYVAASALSYRTLVPVLDDFLAPSGTIAALRPQGRHLSPRTRVFVDFLVGCIGRDDQP